MILGACPRARNLDQSVLRRGVCALLCDSLRPPRRAVSRCPSNRDLHGATDADVCIDAAAILLHRPVARYAVVVGLLMWISGKCRRLPDRYKQPPRSTGVDAAVPATVRLSSHGDLRA